MANEINIGTYNTLANANAVKNEGYISTIEALTSDISASTDAMVAAASGMTDARGETALSVEARKTGELQAQEKMHEFYSALGQDAAGAAKLTNQLGEQYKSAMQKTSELAHSVAQRKSVQFLDNPLGWLFNQIVLPDEEQALAGASSEAKAAADGIDRVNKMLSDTAKNEQEYAQKMTTASVQSQIEGMKNRLTVESEQYKIQARQQNIQNLQAVMQANGQQLDRMGKVIEMRNSMEHLRLAQAARADAHAQFLQWEKDVKDTATANKQKFDWINASIQEAGGKPVEFGKVSMFLNGKAPLPAELQAHLERGYQMATVGLNTFGIGPAEAAQFGATVKVRAPEQVQAIITEASRAVQAELKLKGVTLKDQAQFNKLVDEKVGALLSDYSTIRKGDASNPYLLPSNTAMYNSEAVKETALYRNVLSDAATKGLETRDIGVIRDTAIQAVADGKITQQEAIDGLYTYVKAGTIANSVNNNFYRWGIKEPSTYKSGGVNWMNYQEVQREVIKRANQFNAGNPFFAF